MATRLSGPLLVLATVFASAAAAPALAMGPEMILNGSFESPHYGATGVYSGGGDDWIHTFEGPVSIIRGNIKDGENRLYGATPFGKQYLGLDPRSREGFYAGDSQTIPGFVAGQRYLLEIHAADSDGGLAPVLDVSLNDGSSHNYEHHVYALPVGGPYGSQIQFQTLRKKFVSKVTGEMTLTMRNMGTGNDPGSISIDKVSIHELSDQEADALDAAEATHSSAFGR
jgi:hypothetical protein